MKTSKLRLHSSLSRSILCIAATLAPVVALSGCAIGAASFPDSSPVPEHATLGSISGSNFGGHAPLIGAHVYVLQPSTSGYGTRATSILNSTGANNGATNPTPVQNTSDPDIPTTWYYQTTDLTGAFNITGDYTCTVGLPVYLYLYGGSPTYPSANNVFNVTNISSVNSTGEVTFTVSTVENAYIGETVTFANLSSTNGFSALNGSTRTIDSVNLTTSTFSINVGAGNTANYSAGGDGGGTATLNPTFNPGVVNIASLGICPSGGFTGANAISYVYVNEVATVAAAYAFKPFQLTPSSTTTGNNATYIGTTSTNIAGIQNAAVVAKQLYDITGSKLSTTYAGEGHIANTTTVAGNGIVPQENIDTLANILAACVDSNNTGTSVTTSGGAGTGTSAQCATLFSNATSTGVPIPSSNSNYSAGTAPLDIAQAAINIARHPAGPIYNYSATGSTSFVSALFNLPQGNRPFTPDLSSRGVTASQLNDFTIGILYTVANNSASSGGSYMNGVESIAIDKIGNVWAVANNNVSPSYFYEISPAGVISNVNQATFQYGTVVIDSGESAWTASGITKNAVTYVHNTNSATAVPAAGSAPVTYTYNTGTTNTTDNTYYAYSSVADYFGNVYFGNGGVNGSTGSAPNDYIATFPGAATNPTVSGTESAQITGISNATPVSFFNGSVEPYATGNNTTSAFFVYNAYTTGQVQIDSIQLNSTTSGTPISTGTPVNDTGFPVYGETTTGGSPGSTSSTGATAGCTALLNAGRLTTTRSGDAIVPDFANQGGAINAATSSLYYIYRGGAANAGVSSGTCAQISGATLNAGIIDGYASGLDGNDYVYIANRPSSSATSLSVVDAHAGVAGSVVAVSPSTGYVPQYWNGSALTSMLPNPFNVSIGPSGTVWVVNSNTSFGLVEIVGLGAPTATPFSIASGSSTVGSLIGYKP